MRLRRLTPVVCLMTVVSMGQDSATLAVLVADPSGAMIPGAEVSLTDLRRGLSRSSASDNEGQSYFAGVTAGDYAVDVRKAGFERMHYEPVRIGLRARLTLRLELRLSSVATQSVTVTDRAEGISSDPASGVLLDQDYVKSLPVNGRNIDSLVLMAPGVTSPAGGRGGGMNANGLRSNTNYYTLDGVSVSGSPGPGGGAGPGAGGPPMGGPMGGGLGAVGAAMAGGQSSPISLDAMQEMRVQTSTFAPEFGRTPGAQVSMTSRGGTSQFHGSAFHYFRHESLNANDWFANSASEPRGKLRQNRPGGVLGGPLLRDKTFFFGSYEGLRLTSPQTVIASVPDANTRRTAPAALRPYLNAYPVANGPAVDDGAAQFRAVVTNPSHSDSFSFRLDHAVSARSNGFLRYGLVTNAGDARGTEFLTPNVLSHSNSKSHAATGGLTTLLTGGGTNELRVNYSLTRTRSHSAMDGFGGAVPLDPAAVFPPGVTSNNGDFSFAVLGLGSYSLSSRSATEQRQWNVVDSVTKILGTHHYKFGTDVRQARQTNTRKDYTQSVSFRDLNGDEDGSVRSGVALNASVASNLPDVHPKYTNVSLYAQDTWRATERTTLTYGLRWDINPAPGVHEGPRPFALSSSGVAGVTQNEPLYRTRWTDIAPRFGLAYQIDTTPGREMIFRAGLGIFYDIGYGASLAAYNGAPYSSVRQLTSVNFPLSASDRASPSLPPARPYGQLTTAETNLKSPLVTQWNATVERLFGPRASLSVGYAGTQGKRLLRTETQPSFSDAYDILMLATNGAESSYHGLQVQYRRRFASAWQTQVSYTYAHSIDTASADGAIGGGFASIFGGGQRGSSDYDIRHNLNFSGSYTVPSPSNWARPLLGGWNADWVATARTGLPFDVQGVSADSSSSGSRPGGLFAQVRPDYNGLPVWIDDPNVPGGRRLNRSAFTEPSGFAQGNLGRNVIRGYAMTQIDLSVRRQFQLAERWQLGFTAQAFNILNQPNFLNPSPQEGANLSSPNFGIVNRMAGQGPGNSTYRTGGPRSVELSMRLTF